MVDQRARLLRAALGFLTLEPREPELRRLHRCFDNWRGIGEVVAGLARQGYDLELRATTAAVGARASSKAREPADDPSRAHGANSTSNTLAVVLARAASQASRRRERMTCHVSTAESTL